MTYWPVNLDDVHLGPGFMGHADDGTYRARYGYHTGLDFILNANLVGPVAAGNRVVPVYAVEDGVVDAAEVRATPGYGTIVRIYHPQFGVRTRSAHLGSVSVKEGQAVKAGQQIGTLGTSGTDNYHLHFDVMHKYHATVRFNPHNPAVDGLSPVVHAKNWHEAALTLEYFQDPLRFMAHRPAYLPGTETATVRELPYSRERIA